MRPITLLTLISSTVFISAQQQAPICEDTFNTLPPFNNNAIPCLLGCGLGEPRATGSLLPGAVNTTAIPFCRLNCVHPSGVTPAQSSAAPACNDQCEKLNSATPDQLGWCMYWCVEGGEVGEMVVGTTCVPSIQYTPVATETRDGITLTVQGFTMPTQWAEWYLTQTVIPRTSPLPFAPSQTVAADSSPSSDGGYYDNWGIYHGPSKTTTLAGHCGTSEYEVPCSSSATTTSRRMLFSSTHSTSTSTATTPTIDAQGAQSVGMQSASTTSAESGASGSYRPQLMLQAMVAGMVAFG